jgi:hypothetical protein
VLLVSQMEKKSWEVMQKVHDQIRRVSFHPKIWTKVHPFICIINVKNYDRKF